MHGPEVLLAGERWTTARSLPGRPEMRPAAIWHEGTQLIPSTFPLVNKCLETAWPKAWASGKPIHKRIPQPHQPDQGLGSPGNGGWPVRPLRRVWDEGTEGLEAQQGRDKG